MNVYISFHLFDPGQPPETFENWCYADTERNLVHYKDEAFGVMYHYSKGLPWLDQARKTSVINWNDLPDQVPFEQFEYIQQIQVLQNDR